MLYHSVYLDVWVRKNLQNKQDSEVGMPVIGELFSVVSS